MKLSAIPMARGDGRHPVALRLCIAWRQVCTLGRLAALSVLLLAGGGCASVPAPQTWESRLQGNGIVLLGEQHDNAEHHRQRLQVLRRALAAGWRPAIAMEQLDRERQADIDRARADKPGDAQHVIDAATQVTAGPGVRKSNWDWRYYRPFIALALQYDLPLIGANLSTADTSRIVREGNAAIFDPGTMRRLRLDQAVPPAVQAAQEREIETGHCNALPAKLLPAMARGQMARDAVMADSVARHASHGVVLLAGNGHVRKDLGVPRWLEPTLRARTLAVGFLEPGHVVGDGVFDAVVTTAAFPREDPCIAFVRNRKPG